VPLALQSVIDRRFGGPVPQGAKEIPDFDIGIVKNLIGKESAASLRCTRILKLRDITASMKRESHLLRYSSATSAVAGRRARP
jgi:hypothetical protein